MRAPCFFALLLLGCSGPSPEPTPDEAPPAEAPAPAAEAAPPGSFGPASLASGDEVSPLLARLDADIAFRVERAEAQPSGAVDALSAAVQGRMARAGLSGRYGDYEAADVLLARAFAAAPKEDPGLRLLRARLDLTLHRLGGVLEDLDAVPTTVEVGRLKPHLAIMARGTLAAQRGDVDEAKRRYNEVMRMKPGFAEARSAMAWIHWQTGDFESAEGLYGEAEANTPASAARPRAWLELQRGLMDLDRERNEEALAHYRAADELLPGWWLIHEHIAEVTLLLGHEAAAVALYEKVIEDTDGSPEFLDALAGIRRAQGDEEAAAALIGRSREVWESRLKRLPEASYGHALDHFLKFGPPERALEIARKNHDLRPNGDAKVRLIHALLGSGEVAEAQVVANDLEASPWDTRGGREAIAAARAATP